MIFASEVPSFPWFCTSFFAQKKVVPESSSKAMDLSGVVSFWRVLELADAGGDFIWWFGTWLDYDFPYIWVNYNDLTATSLESWLVRENIPK